ncbi:7SK snRNA methylphosphate capping enzyme [Cherax quadricarinatus]
MSSELGVERPTTLTLPESQVERRVHFSDVDGVRLVTNKQSHVSTTPSPRKSRADHDFRPKRKRSISFSSAGEFRFGNKRRKKGRVLPSKFLLGGNITDPLNLGSLDKEEVTQLGSVEVTGSAVSKRSGAVRVIIPPNINDPLNLDVSSDNEDSLTDALQKQLRRRRRNRKRKRRLSEPSGSTLDSISLHGLLDVDRAESKTMEIRSETNLEVSREVSLDAMKPLAVNTESNSTQGTTDGCKEGPVTPTGAKPSTSGMQRPVFKKQRSKSENKIVSPVIPQPGGERKRHPSHSRHYAERPHLSQQNLQPPKKYNPKNELFQYGNYNKYYGYRNPDQTPDVRLECLRREWFEGKEILDIGCNIGHITLTVARDYNPKRVVGIDIDKKLVSIAEKNIKHYLRKGDTEEANFPKSMRLLYGTLKPPVRADGTRTFPYNVKFVHANYVLESDELLETVRPEFDTILCLSITKWVHLNWGDSGLKRFFWRIFHNLKPGGRFVLEPQGWPSYNKRRKLTKRIFENYINIRLFPDKFNDFLLHEVGFNTSEKIITPHHASRGFQRPIIIYTKAGGSNKSSPLEESRSKDTNIQKFIGGNKIIPEEYSKRKNTQPKELNKNATVGSNVENNTTNETYRNKELKNVEKNMVKELTNDSKIPIEVTENVDHHNQEVFILIREREDQCKVLMHNTTLTEPTVQVPEYQAFEVLEDTYAVSKRWKKAASVSKENKQVCDTRVIKELLVSEVNSCVTHSSSDAQNVNRICEMPYLPVSKIEDKSDISSAQSTNNCHSCVTCKRDFNTALTRDLGKEEILACTDKYDNRTVSPADTVTDKDNLKCICTQSFSVPKQEDNKFHKENENKKYFGSVILPLKEHEKISSATHSEQHVKAIPGPASLQINKLEPDVVTPLKHFCASTFKDETQTEECKKQPRLENVSQN